MTTDPGGPRTPRRDTVPGTQAVRRAITILKSFTEHHPTWDAAALSADLGLTKATTVRLLHVLEAEGLLYRGERGVFHLGPDLIVMGGLASRSMGWRDSARKVLHALSEKTGESVTLEVPWRSHDGQDAAMVVVDEVSGRHLLGVQQYYGRHLPIHATSTGKVILAFGATDGRGRALNGLVRYTEATITDADRLEHELAIVRERGFATAVDELEVGLVAVAAPIFDGAGNCDAAISIVCPSVRFAPERMHEVSSIVLDAAASIARQRGHVPADQN